MTTNFQDASGEIRLVGTIYAPGATVGDVFTVQSDGSLAAEPGGGSQTVNVIKHPFDFSQAVALKAGVTIWTPAVGDVLLDAWIETPSDDAWVTEGATSALADIGVIVAGAFDSSGFFNFSAGPVDLTSATWDESASGAFLHYNQALASSLSAAMASFAASNIYEPKMRFAQSVPVKLVATQTGAPAGDAIDASAGASVLYLVTATPEAV